MSSYHNEHVEPERQLRVMSHIRKLPYEGWCWESGKQKPRYRNRKLAMQALSHMRRLPTWQGIGSVYKCRGCGDWHVSHMATFWENDLTSDTRQPSMET